MPTVSSRWSAFNRALAVFALAVAAGAQAADSPPVIREIVFRGNETTQPSTMLREMHLQVGDTAGPREIEHSRQGVQNLGLFRSVDIDQEPVEGGVRLVVTVKEKFYVLVLPRADYSSDGGYGWGVQMRWNNVWGLNHTFTPYFERRQPSEGDNDPEKRGLQTRGQLRYFAPFVFDSAYGIGFHAAYFKTPYLAPIRYEETTSSLGLSLSRKLGDDVGSRGWTVGAGPTWHNDDHSGALAPPERGHAVALVTFVQHNDVNFNIYSDSGSAFVVAASTASRNVISDYAFDQWNVGYSYYLPVGSTPHQNLNLHVNYSERHDTDIDEAYSVGGVETLRGFEPETAKGDAYYAVSVEYLRPVFRRSIRMVAVLDAANAFAAPEDVNFDKVYVSAGLGVRVRFQAVVNFEFELGWAWPLNGGPPRVFASKI